MSENVKTFTPEDLVPEKMSGKVLVDFWAAWCGPCRMVAPTLEQIADERKDMLTVGKVNIDHHTEYAVSLGIQSIPTMILFKDGVEAERLVGAYPKDLIEEMIDRA